MNLVPLHVTPVPGCDLINDDGVAKIINFDHVYRIDRYIYYPKGSKDGVEGSTIYFNTVRLYGETMILNVKESRVQIMRMMESAEERERSLCTETKTQKSHEKSS